MSNDPNTFNSQHRARLASRGVIAVTASLSLLAAGCAREPWHQPAHEGALVKTGTDFIPSRWGNASLTITGTETVSEGTIEVCDDQGKCVTRIKTRNVVRGQAVLPGKSDGEVVVDAIAKAVGAAGILATGIGALTGGFKSETNQTSVGPTTSTTTIGGATTTTIGQQINGTGTAPSIIGSVTNNNLLRSAMGSTALTPVGPRDPRSGRGTPGNNKMPQRLHPLRDERYGRSEPKVA